MKIRVLLCDDQEQGRSSLGRMLEQLGYVEVVAGCAHGADAVEMARRLNPDVVYMDLKMPGIDGIEAARRIREFSPRVFLIFATAYQEGALSAFKLYAYDYLLKPFKFKRNKQTMDRIKEDLENSQKQPARGLAVKVGWGTWILKPEDVVFLEKKGKKTLVHTTRGIVETLQALGELEERLDPLVFLRVHVGYIVNVGKISYIKPAGDRTYEVGFQDYPKTAFISRGYVPKVKKHLSL